MPQMLGIARRNELSERDSATKTQGFLYRRGVHVIFEFGQPSNLTLQWLHFFFFAD
jgi:hypothetical protein